MTNGICYRASFILIENQEGRNGECKSVASGRGIEAPALPFGDFKALA
jgi:hypothetical protein